MKTFNQIPQYSILDATINPKNGSTVVDVYPHPDGGWIRFKDVEDFITSDTSSNDISAESTAAFWSDVFKHIRSIEKPSSVCLLSTLGRPQPTAITSVIANLSSYANMVTGNPVVVLHSPNLAPMCEGLKDAVKVSSLSGNTAYILELKKDCFIKKQLTGAMPRMSRPSVNDIVSVMKILAD